MKQDDKKLKMMDKSITSLKKKRHDSAEILNAIKSFKDSVKDGRKGDEVYRLCKHYDFYTGGTVKDYEELLHNADNWDLEKIARNILEHSNNKTLTELDIYSVRNMMDFITKNTAIKDSVKDYYQPISSFKSFKYLDKNERGDEIVKVFEDIDDGRMHVIVHRNRDYVIGLGYSPEDGVWNQGRYGFETLEDAEKALKENYNVKLFIKPKVEDAVKDEMPRRKPNSSLILDEKMFDDEEGYASDFFKKFVKKMNEWVGNDDTSGESWVAHKNDSQFIMYTYVDKYMTEDEFKEILENALKEIPEYKADYSRRTDHGWKRETLVAPTVEDGYKLADYVITLHGVTKWSKKNPDITQVELYSYYVKDTKCKDDEPDFEETHEICEDNGKFKSRVNGGHWEEISEDEFEELKEAGYEEINCESNKTVGEQLAELFENAIYTEFGGVGPFGGEHATVKGNTIELTSQSVPEIYRFNDDGSVDLVNVKEVAEYWAEDDVAWMEEGEDKEAAKEADYNSYIKYNSHFDNLDDLRDNMSWFYNLSDKVFKKAEEIIRGK